MFTTYGKLYSYGIFLLNGLFPVRAAKNARKRDVPKIKPFHSPHKHAVSAKDGPAFRQKNIRWKAYLPSPGYFFAVRSYSCTGSGLLMIPKPQKRRGRQKALPPVPTPTTPAQPHRSFPPAERPALPIPANTGSAYLRPPNG